MAARAPEPAFAYNDPEGWMLRWVASQGRVGHHGQIEYLSVQHPAGGKREPINGGHPLGMIRIQGREESMDNWELINTEGDGTCMIHSFLLQLSQTYRDLQPGKQRSEAGIAYRAYLHQQLTGPHSQRGDVFSEEIYDRLMIELKNKDTFLRDDMLTILGTFFNVGVIYMVCSRYGAVLTVDRQQPDLGGRYVMISNYGGRHYEALVRRRGTFTVDESVATGIMNNYATMVERRDRNRLLAASGGVARPAASDADAGAARPASASSSLLSDAELDELIGSGVLSEREIKELLAQNESERRPRPPIAPPRPPVAPPKPPVVPPKPPSKLKCQVILQSGVRKGKKCERDCPCQYHKMQNCASLGKRHRRTKRLKHRSMRVSNHRSNFVQGTKR
jgi:hypothetical protein